MEVTGELSALSLEGGFTFYLPNFCQHFLRFTSLPLRVVETLVGLAEIHLAETSLRIFDRPQREVQPLTRFAQPIDL
jgi:hypothetical protein